MRRYETVFIVDPDVGEDVRKEIFNRSKDLVPAYNGQIIEFDEWGSRKLAYEIRKKIRGYYVRMDYCGNGDLVDELERTMRLDDKVLKYMTILVEKEADPEKVLAENAASKAAAEAAQAEAREKETTEETETE